jgi:para-nitrobenzyl esterase
VWRASAVAMAIAVIAMTVTPASAGEPVRVTMKSGVLVGTLDNGVESFKGIPYATPPLGALRLALPRPAVPWSGERTADDFGPSCMQDSVPRNVPPGGRAAQLSEDCLTLNIWAPQTARKAPVMVWLHGGGNDSGSSADIYYDGTAFARDGVVLVSLNYRLGSFGFKPHDGEANFGLWDQVAALGWVRDNIASFGGDPANVTLFGESAGGEDTLALMTAAPARGLFQKAIVESGGGGWGPPPTLAEVAGHAATAGHDAAPGNGTAPEHDAAAGRDVTAGHAAPPGRDVTAGHAAPPGRDPAATNAAAEDATYDLTIDGHLLKEPPLTAFAAGRAAHIPLIIGTNSEESSLLGPDARTEGLFPKLSKDDQGQLTRLYGSLAPNDSALARLEFRDGHFASEARWIATKVSATGAPAYLYRFEYVLGVLQSRRAGAFHGSEIPFVFGHLPTQRVDENDLRVERAMHDCWTAFARTGKPTCADAPDWPQFGQGDKGQPDKWMVFDAHPAARALEGADALDLLQCRLAEAPLTALKSCPAK